MKVLLITENYKFEPLGVAYLSSVLKKEGHNVEYSQLKNAVRNFKRFRPEMVGYSILTGSQNNFIELSKVLKELNPNVINVFGGPHPTYFPEVIKEDSVDYVVRGEGESGILKIFKNPSEKVIIGDITENLDNIPFPDRDVIYNGMENEANNPIKHVIASRGCPFSCPYCYNDGFKKLYSDKKTLRFRSPENVIEEIKLLKSNYGAKFIQFQDDAFTSNPPWLLKFLPLYESEIGLPFQAILRLDQVSESLIKKMKKAGLHSVRAAVESGNDNIRQNVLKRNMSKEQMRKACSLFHKYDIKFLLQNILGLPEGNLETDMETMYFNRELNPTYGWASIFQPYPGTELGDKHGCTLESVNSDFYSGTPLDIEDKEKRIFLRQMFGTLVSGKSIDEANVDLYAGFLA